MALHITTNRREKPRSILYKYPGSSIVRRGWELPPNTPEHLWVIHPYIDKVRRYIAFPRTSN